MDEGGKSVVWRNMDLASSCCDEGKKDREINELVGLLNCWEIRCRIMWIKWFVDFPMRWLLIAGFVDSL